MSACGVQALVYTVPRRLPDTNPENEMIQRNEVIATHGPFQIVRNGEGAGGGYSLEEIDGPVVGQFETAIEAANALLDKEDTIH